MGARALTALAVGLTLACGDAAAPDGGRCVSGASMPCTLPTGEDGVRTCGMDFRWLECGELDVPDGGGVKSLPRPPEPPRAPSLPPVDCPDGWREVESGGVTTCDPWPEDGPSDCASDEAHFPGSAGCALLGRPCPVGSDFSTDLPTDKPAIYVLEGATGGDGTLALPFGDLFRAAFDAAPGTVIAVGRGTYNPSFVALRGGSELRGACVAETTLRKTGSIMNIGFVDTTGPDSVVRDIHIVNEGFAVGLKTRSGDATIDGVVIDGATEFGVIVDGGSTARVHHLVVRDVSAQTGAGISITEGASAELHEVLVERAPSAGIYLDGEGSNATVRDSVVRDGLGGRLNGGTDGRGLAIQGQATSLVERSVFERNRRMGVAAAGSGSELRVVDVVVQDTDAQLSDLCCGFGVLAGNAGLVVAERLAVLRNRLGGVTSSGRGSLVAIERSVVRDTRAMFGVDSAGTGIQLLEEGSVRARHARLVANRGIALAVDGVGTDLILEDVEVRDTNALDDGLAGFGMQITGGADVAGARVELLRNLGAGIAATGSGTTLALEHVSIHDTASSGVEASAGIGLSVRVGVVAELRRISLERNRHIGVWARGAGAQLSLFDATVADTESVGSPEIVSGMGLETAGGARVELQRAVFVRNGEVSLRALGIETVVSLEHVTVAETVPRTLDGHFGRGMEIQAGAHVQGSNVLVRSNREVGIRTNGADSLVSLTDVQLRDTLARACGSDGCPDDQAGTAVVADLDAEVRLERFAITNAALCGIQIAAGAGADLRSGEVTGCQIGACVQVEDFDFARLQRDVQYMGNGFNLDSTMLPVPTPAAGMP